MLKIAPCPVCVDGREVNIVTGTAVPCTVCHGTHFVTPNFICYCGSSCSIELNGIPYCGDVKCLEELQKDRRVESFYPRPIPVQTMNPTFAGHRVPSDRRPIHWSAERTQPTQPWEQGHMWDN